MSIERSDDYLNISIGGFSDGKADTVITNEYGQVIFISMMGYSSTINMIKPMLNSDRTHTICVDNKYSSTSNFKYTIKTKKATNSDYMHMIAYANDTYNTRNNNETYTSYIFTDNEANIDKELYKRLVKYSSIPILEEWIPYIRARLESQSRFRCLDTKVYNLQDRQPLICYVLIGTRGVLENIVHEGLNTKEINIDGSNEHSIVLDSCTGLDNYLQLFGEGLAKKIQMSFRPKFIPGEDTYDNYLYNIDDYVYYNAGVNLYEAQRSAIQAIVNNMDLNKNTFLVGEMGAGKTLMASSACYVHNANKNKGINVLVMCPSHLVNNWKNEIARFIPNSRSYIIHNVEELLAIKDRLEDPYKIENSFVIMSKEIAKIGYGNRPAVLFKRVGYYQNEHGDMIKANNVFVCPECGQVLTKIINVPAYPGSNRKVKRKVPLELTDFAKEYSYNNICTNDVKIYDPKEEIYKTVMCKNKLWTAMNRDDENLQWVKLGKSGWFHVDSIDILMDYYLNSGVKMTKKDAELFDNLSDQHNSLIRTGEIDRRFNGTKKYPVAKYIKKRMPNVFDYGIFDEAQAYKGKTEQGHAFHILAQSCRKTITMTGTLMNGYVNSMYYLLYRLLPQAMKREGFNYEDEAEFNRIFGVNSTTTVMDGRTVKRRSNKLLPGISSLVFTKFLLNNTVFVSLEDMTEGLPNYTEIPYSVEMDETTARYYNGYEQFMRRMATGREGDKKYIRQYCRRMLTIPDAPHCMEDELSEENTVLFAAPEIEEFTTNKDLALLDIINTKVTAGEKVLVYYNDVGTTNLGDHIRLTINSYGYKSAELKASTKAEKREEFINKLVRDGYDVLICNPSLVETGLNLLDFTTIVFYQLGYNLNTMRQASRRSWRLSQDKDITVYFLYYSDTTQEATLSLMATKLHAAQSMEGKFSEEGLRAMSDNQDVLTQIASNVVDGIKNTVDQSLFQSANHVKQVGNVETVHNRKPNRIEVPMDSKGHRNAPSIFNRAPKPCIPKKLLKVRK